MFFRAERGILYTRDMQINEFFFRILNALTGHSAVVDSVVYFLAQPLALLATLVLALYAAYEIVRAPPGEAGKQVLHTWVLVFVTAIVAWFIGDIVQGLIAYPRPFLELLDTNLLFPYGGRDSFPSGHTTFLSGLTAALYFLFGKKRVPWVFVVVTVAVGLARVTAGVHWPFDIVGGIILGCVVAWGVSTARKYFK
ncbi:MAG: hypothetical protein A3J08_03125 [Candidatus Lloydbacteria bacterium RIFCSPLOWO2_02_FULL_51_11]|uniref:Phosphatidic acid phosphatase type 2/haloperoxidase domain-containing protein n=2 Tax=Candidatus Lloydiibacteriota TaxID=1817910 RepID=A0A1G2DNH3_9BACT|nr:MAG: hypothetical protein A3J08_03125 [Candidatus Lloydbacteria bacterium RIFCSPLOWO2_02_FULL_51_11]